MHGAPRMIGGDDEDVAQPVPEIRRAAKQVGGAKPLAWHQVAMSAGAS